MNKILKALSVSLATFSIGSHAATVKWSVDDLENGPVTRWFGSGSQSVLANKPGNNIGAPVKNADGLFFDGNDALQISAQNNFLKDTKAWSVTVRFKADATQGEGGATRTTNPNPRNPDEWWSNAALVGLELPGSNKGDWGVFLNSENALVTGNGGSPSSGLVWESKAFADGNWHIATVVYNDTPKDTNINREKTGRKNRSLYVDGQAVRAQQGISLNMQDSVINFGCNTINQVKAQACFTGNISNIELTDQALSHDQVRQLHRAYGFRSEISYDIFNGKNFDGWGTSIQNDSGDIMGDDIWSVTPSGGITADAFKKPQSALYTLNQNYGNYELNFEYRYLDDRGTGNSGVLLLGAGDFIDSKGAFQAAIEMQLRRGFEGDLLRKQLYMEAEPGWPTAKDQGKDDHRIIRRANPRGNTVNQWHSVRIVAETTRNQGSTVSVWINNVFVNKGINTENNAGSIVFQAEGSDIQFRNIELAPLASIADTLDVLIYKAGASNNHKTSQESAIQALEQAATNDANFDINFAEADSPTVFSDDNLASFDAVVFVHTSFKQLNDNQRAAFQRFIRAGGGYVGTHTAAWGNSSWQWYVDLVGGFSGQHPSYDDYPEYPNWTLLGEDAEGRDMGAVQPGTVQRANNSHPSTSTLPGRQFKIQGEWYNWNKKDPRSNENLRILVTADENSYVGGEGEISGNPDESHPISWCQLYDGGRSWYTELSHDYRMWENNRRLQRHFYNGVLWAAGVKGLGSDCNPD